MVAGRDWPGLARIDDLPGPGLGPLGGLAGALAYAAGNGFEAVLTTGCDLPGLPTDLRARLARPTPSCAVSRRSGYGTAGSPSRLAHWLRSTTDRSVRAWGIAAEAPLGVGGRSDRQRQHAGRSRGVQSFGGSAIIAVKLTSVASLPFTEARPANLQTLPRICTTSTSSTSSTPGSTGTRNLALSMPMK